MQAANADGPGRRADTCAVEDLPPPLTQPSPLQGRGLFVHERKELSERVDLEKAVPRDTPARSAPSKPNVLLILVDDLGYGDPGCFNPESKIPTPSIDRLAREGMRFTDAHAAGAVCHPSRYGLLTGQYPFRTNTGLWEKQPVIAEGQTTIASLLSGQGYRTAMVGKWHLGFRENGYDKPLAGGPVDRGFDSFFGIRASTDIPPYFYIRDNRAVAAPTEPISARSTEGWSPIQGEFWREGTISPGMTLKDVLPRFTEEALKVIDAHVAEKDSSRKPLFLYFAPTGPHTPWLPSPEFVGKSGAGLYGDFVMMVDAQVGRILSALDKHGIAKDTLVLFSSDNGPVWYDKDKQKFGHDSSGGLRGMKADAWEGGHRMPFVARWPTRVKPGSVTGQTICFTDVMATLAAICGTPLPDNAGPDSFSFLPVLDGIQPEEKPIRPPLVLQAGRNKTMLVRSGEWKLVLGDGTGGLSGSGKSKPAAVESIVQLYNLREDPGETTNQAERHQEKVAELQAIRRDILDRGRSR